MSAEQLRSTITVEGVNKESLPANLRVRVDDKIVTVRHGENTLTLLRPNVRVEDEHVHVHQDGLVAADLPLSVLSSEVNISDLNFDARSSVVYWVCRMYGHQEGYAMFPDLNPNTKKSIGS